MDDFDFENFDYTKNWLDYYPDDKFGEWKPNKKMCERFKQDAPRKTKGNEKEIANSFLSTLLVGLIFVLPAMYLGIIGLSILGAWLVYVFKFLSDEQRLEFAGKDIIDVNYGLWTEENENNKYSVNRKANDKEWFEIGVILDYDCLPKSYQLFNAFNSDIANEIRYIQNFKSLNYITRSGVLKDKQILGPKKYQNYGQTITDEVKLEIYKRLLKKIGVKDDELIYYIGSEEELKILENNLNLKGEIYDIFTPYKKRKYIELKEFNGFFWREEWVERKVIKPRICWKNGDKKHSQLLKDIICYDLGKSGEYYISKIWAISVINDMLLEGKTVHVLENGRPIFLKYLNEIELPSKNPVVSRENLELGGYLIDYYDDDFKIRFHLQDKNGKPVYIDFLHIYRRYECEGY